jgi:hypothetical protein
MFIAVKHLERKLQMKRKSRKIEEPKQIPIDMVRAYFDATIAVVHVIYDSGFFMNDYTPDDIQLKAELENLKLDNFCYHPAYLFHRVYAAYTAAKIFDPTAEKEAFKWTLARYRDEEINCLRVLKNPDPEPWFEMTQKLIEDNWYGIKALADHLMETRRECDSMMKVLSSMSCSQDMDRIRPSDGLRNLSDWNGDIVFG